MKPFFCFFGGKWRSALAYPAPRFRRIYEPFAGAAGYATRHHQRDVILCDTDPIICGVWDYLIRSSSAEIMSLPAVISHVDEIHAPQEARWLVGFWLNKGSVSPRLTPSAWMRSGIRPQSYWGEAIRSRIASQVDLIKHWQVACCSYEETEDDEATWFIDPPYQGPSGRLYRQRGVDYGRLGQWCRSRRGQVIVCEKQGATWLPFREMGIFKSTEGSRGKNRTHEAVWTNDSVY